MSYLSSYKPNKEFKHPASDETGLPLQLSLALIMLLTELDTKMPITSSSKGSTLSCINRYVPIVPKARTRKETFEILLLNGFYVPRKNKSN